MVHNWSPSLHITLKEFSNKDGAASDAGGSSRSPGTRGCNVVIPIHPITATLASENTPALQTILTAMVRTVVPQLGMDSSSINNKLTRRSKKHEPAPD
jgi:hypothetical protein